MSVDPESHQASSAPFDSLAAQLLFNSSQHPHTEAVAALASGWFAVIRESFREAKTEAARADGLCRRNQFDDLEPFARGLLAMIEAFQGHRGLVHNDLDGLAVTLTLPCGKPADQYGPLWLKCVLETPNWLTFADRYTDATMITERLLQTSRQTQHADGEVQTLGCRVELDLRRGRWVQCRSMLSEAFTISHKEGFATGYLDVLAARLAAGSGQTTTLEQHLSSARMYAYDRGDSSTLWRADAAEAFAAIGNGDPELAEALLQPLVSGPNVSGGHLASVRLWDGDLVEALVGVGKVAEDRHIVDRLSSPFPSVWASATEARCRALVEDPTEGFAHAMDSVGGFERIGATFEQARSVLVAGELSQRIGMTRRAWVLLRQARTTFEALGAIPWADRSTRALAACRLPTCDDMRSEPIDQNGQSSMRQLTTQEREIVSALSKGASNREISQQLFISIKTVEAHLTHAYQKFGVISRTQLIAKMLESTS